MKTLGYVMYSGGSYLRIDFSSSHVGRRLHVEAVLDLDLATITPHPHSRGLGLSSAEYHRLEDLHPDVEFLPVVVVRTVTRVAGHGEPQ